MIRVVLLLIYRNHQVNIYWYISKDIDKNAFKREIQNDLV